MSETVPRKMELVLCDVLGAAVSSIPFYPLRGGATGGEIVPPYAVVSFADGGEKPFANEDTYILSGSLTIVTHIGDTRGAEHDALINRIRVALDKIQRGFYPDRLLVLSGLDAQPATAVTDDEKRCHGDVFELEVNCTGVQQEDVDDVEN